MEDDWQNPEADMLNFNLFLTSVFRFAKDRWPSFERGNSGGESVLLKGVRGMGSDGFRKAKDLFLKVRAVDLGPRVCK